MIKPTPEEEVIARLQSEEAYQQWKWMMEKGALIPFKKVDDRIVLITNLQDYMAEYQKNGSVPFQITFRIEYIDDGAELNDAS